MCLRSVAVPITRATPEKDLRIRKAPPHEQWEDPILNLHAILPRSKANGPGDRMVIWFQGCSLGCPGCFNPKTHSPKHRLLVPVERLLRRIHEECTDLDGITISGGEPLEQAPALLKLLRMVAEQTELSVILFSGYTLQEIQATENGPEILCLIDVLISGRFLSELRHPRGLLGSANQEVHYLSERYSPRDLEKTEPAEIRFDADGRISVSGIDPPQFGNSPFADYGAHFSGQDEITQE